MKVKLIGSSEFDTYIPMELSNEPYATEWEGELNDSQLMWIFNAFPDCDIDVWKNYSKDVITVIGITISFNGFIYGD